MTLDRLWAGWRSDYVSDAGTEQRTKENQVELGERESCVFCRIVAVGRVDAATGVLWIGESTLVVLNAYPYSSGHLMALPVRHVARLDDLTGDEADELWAGLRHGVAALESAYRPEGINLGANLGQAAGAGIPRHLHLHAVPRWVGDTNFMTTVADTRVLPETLASSWERLRAAWPVEAA